MISGIADLRKYALNWIMISLVYNGINYGNNFFFLILWFDLSRWSVNLQFIIDLSTHGLDQLRLAYTVLYNYRITF